MVDTSICSHRLYIFMNMNIVLFSVPLHMVFHCSLYFEHIVLTLCCPSYVVRDTIRTIHYITYYIFYCTVHYRCHCIHYISVFTLYKFHSTLYFSLNMRFTFKTHSGCSLCILLDSLYIIRYKCLEGLLRL